MECIPKRKPRKKKNEGALIIAIIVLIGSVFSFGIVAAFAIPAYAAYTKRVRIGEGLALAAQYKTQVLSCYLNNDSEWPTGTEEGIIRQCDLPTFRPTKNTQRIAVLNGGVIEIEFTNKVERGGRKILLIPNHNRDGSVTWRCSNAPSPDGFKSSSTLPIECRQ